MLLGRLTDDLTVECFAPFHAAGIAEVAVNGATGIQLRYNSTAFENAELSVEGETDTVATGEVLGVLPRRVSTLGSPRSVAMLGKNFAPGRRGAWWGSRAGRASLCRRH